MIARTSLLILLILLGVQILGAQCNVTINPITGLPDCLGPAGGGGSYTPVAIPNTQSGTTYTVDSADRAKVIILTNAGTKAITLPQAGASFPSGWYAYIKNAGAGTATVTPTISTISGAASQAIDLGEFCLITSDGTNYEALCNRIVAGTNVTLTKGRTEVTIAASGGATSRTYNFQGVTQAGVSAWNMNYTALTNMVFASTDATHQRAALTVTANTTGSALLSITPVTSTNPSVQFIAEVRSTDGINAGSMALAYACVAAGSSVDNPSQTSLTPISLTTIASTKSIYSSTQSVTCTGTPSSPADLYIWWTPTAPSGGTLTLLRMSLTY